MNRGKSWAFLTIVIGALGTVSCLGLLNFVPPELVWVQPYREFVLAVSFALVVSISVGIWGLVRLNHLTEGEVLRGCALAAECVGVALTGTLSYNPNREEQRNPSRPAEDRFNRAHN